MAKKTEKHGVQKFAGVMLYERKNARYWETISQWFAIVMLGLLPFLMDSQKYYNLTKSRYAWFCVLTLLYIALISVVALGFFLYKKAWAKRREEGLQKLNISQYLIIAYLFWACLSSLLSPYRADTWLGQGRYEGLFTIILYGLTFFFLSFWGEYSNKYVYTMGIMATAMSVLAFLQLFGVDFLTPVGYSIWETKFFATLGNIDCVSGVGAVVIPALFCAFVLLESKWRFVCLSGFVLYFYLQVFIRVDSGKMGIIAALLVLLPFLLDRWERAVRTGAGFGALLVTYGVAKLFPITQEGIGLAPGKKAIAALILGAVLVVLGIILEKKEYSFRLSPKQVRRLVLIILVVAVIAALLLLYFYSGENRLLCEIHQVLHGELADNAGSGRGIVWKLSVKFIREMPIFGSGPDTYLSRAMPYYESGALHQVFDFAHNDFLQVGVCLGLGGLVIYLAWIFSMAIRLLKRAVDNPLLLIFGGAMVGYLGHVFFSFSIALVTPMFWVLAGLGDKCMRQMTAPQPEKTEKE